jgi:predicted  nucleic acid-binding Zn-ribbon protein
MAPQPLHPGKRIQRRRRRRNNDCPSCRSQEEQDAFPGGVHENYGLPGAAPEQAGVDCTPLVQRQKLWENRQGETTEYFMKLSTIILAGVSVALAIALIAVHYSKTSQVDQVRTAYLRMSNQWDEARVNLAESGKLVEVLQTDLAARNETIAVVSNDLSRIQTDLGKATLDLAGARAEIGKSQARIIQLEGERDDLAKRMEELNGSITKLESQIADTEQKLKTSEGDKTVLVAELKRLQNERAELQAQFNDLASLRTQLAKVREEHAIKQRMDWFRTGVYARQGQKGAERLMAQQYGASWPRPDNRLDVELERTGGARVVPPSSGAAPQSQ